MRDRNRCGARFEDGYNLCDLKEKRWRIWFAWRKDAPDAVKAVGSLLLHRDADEPDVTSPTTAMQAAREYVTTIWMSSSKELYEAWLPVAEKYVEEMAEADERAELEDEIESLAAKMSKAQARLAELASPEADVDLRAARVGRE